MTLLCVDWLFLGILMFSLHFLHCLFLSITLPEVLSAHVVALVLLLPLHKAALHGLYTDTLQFTQSKKNMLRCVQLTQL